MKTITAELIAQTSGRVWTIGEIMAEEHSKTKASMMTYHPCLLDGYTKLGTATITVEFDDEKSILVGMVESLKEQKNSILAEAQRKATEIEGQIQSLLALDYKVEVTE